MHISKIEIENVRSLSKLGWAVPDDRATGWHVVLGDNGAGKSSFLKSICLALVGCSEAGALRQPWGDWLTRNQTIGKIALELSWDDQYDNFSGKGNTPSSDSKLPVEIQFVRDEEASPPHVDLKNVETGYSPLVCQSAENGSIFLLPKAGSEDKARMLEGTEFHRLVYGNVLDAYGTEAFGCEAALTRSLESKQKHQRLAELNNKEIVKQLTSAEKEEQESLRSI